MNEEDFYEYVSCIRQLEVRIKIRTFRLILKKRYFYFTYLNYYYEIPYLSS